MGTQGSDVWLSVAAAKHFPFAIECKNTESINIWKAWQQAKANTPAVLAPMVVFSKNHEAVLVTLQFDKLLELIK